MLSLDEIKNYEFKKGIGYTKKSVDDFIFEIVETFNEMGKETSDLKDKVVALSEGMQYYKSIEKTLQKSLVLAQKTADEKQEKALNKAKIIEKVARTRADEIITKAKNDLDTIYRQTDELNRRFELYKSYVKNLITTQLDLINSDTYKISVNDLDGYLKLKDQLEEAREAVPEDEEYSEEVTEETSDEITDSEDDVAELFESTLEKIQEEDIEHIPELKHKTVVKPVQEDRPAAEAKSSQVVRQAVTTKPMHDADAVNAAKAPQGVKPATGAKPVAGARPIAGARPVQQTRPMPEARPVQEAATVAKEVHTQEAKPVAGAQAAASKSPLQESRHTPIGVQLNDTKQEKGETLAGAAKDLNNLHAGEMNAQERRVLLARKLAADEKVKQESTKEEHRKEQSTPINENLINRIPRDILTIEDDTF